MNFEAEIHEAGFTIETAAEYLGVTVRTMYRYFREGPPLMARRAIAPRSGKLNFWTGYRFHDQSLIRSDGRAFTRKDLDHFEHWTELPEHLTLLLQMQKTETLLLAKLPEETKNGTY